MSAPPLLRAVLQAMQKHGLEDILIGNAGAAIHGAPVTTIDFDFMFRDTPVNMRKLKAVARECGMAVWKAWYPEALFFRLSPREDSSGKIFEANRRAMPPQRKPRQHRQAALDALKRESDHHLTDLIRRRLAMPLEKRMNFLRKRLPDGGSCL